MNGVNILHLFYLSKVACTGSESGLQYCDHQGWGSNDCSHGEDVSVECGKFFCLNLSDFSLDLQESDSKY